MSRSRTNKTTKQADNGNDHFPPTTALPDTSPSILLCFVGLMGFAYNDHGFCEVGMHCKAPKHDFSISLYDEFSDFDTPLYAFRCGPAQNSPVYIIRLNIVNPTPETKDVSFLISPDIKHDPDLGKILGDQLDFRSLPDLESSDFYRRKLKKKPGAFKPRIFIKSGIICALSTGGSIFKAVAPDASQVIGEVADVVFAAIYLNQDGYVSLRIGSDELKLTTAKHYFVVFDNRCPPSECHF